MVSRSITRVLTLVAAASSASSAELKVEVYSGPTECDTSEKIKDGNHISMHYTGSIHESSATGEKGKEFDSSRKKGRTFDFTVGAGHVITGWDEGLIGLCVGAKAHLIIPPDMAYGETGRGKVIPGGATLYFDVEVVSINQSSQPVNERNLFAKIDGNKDGKLDGAEIEAYFYSLGQSKVPDALWEKEDKDKDGIITWDEFSGPKGSNPMGDEF